MKTKTKDKLQVVTAAHRLSYVHLAEPTSFDEKGAKKYDVTILIPKDHDDVERIKQAMKSAYMDNKESMFKGVSMNSQSMWNPLRDGDEWLAEHPEAFEYANHYFLRASSSRQPKIVDADKQDIFDVEGEVYSGCWGRCIIRCYPFNNVAKGFAFYLNAVMKTKDDDRLGGFDTNLDDFDTDRSDDLF